MISLGMVPGLFPFAVFIVWRLKIVPRPGHVLSCQGGNPKVRKNSDVIANSSRLNQDNQKSETAIPKDIDTIKA